MRLLGPLAAIGLALTASACGKPAPKAADSVPNPTEPASAPAPAAADAGLQKAALADLPAPYDTGDLDHGKALFAQCRSCHTVAMGGADMTGPNLYGIFDRKAGTKAGYTYSDALKGAGWQWDAAHIDSWIANPRTYLPGTKMTFAGFKDEKDRIDLIAYLKVQSGFRPKS